MEPRIIYKPAFTVVGFAQTLTGGDWDSDSLWEQLGTRFQEIPFADPDVGYGVHITTGEARQYLAGLGLTRPEAAVPADMVQYRMGPQTYAVFAHAGLLKDLPATVGAAFESWLPAVGYRPSANYYFEFYDDHFQPDSPLSTLFIWIPVTAG